MPEFVPAEELFKGRHFDREIVILCVRWYLSYKLSYRDLVAMMSERGISMAHTTILRWVQHYSPEFEKRWRRYARAVGGSWRCDETYIKVKGAWVYLYRAVDKGGQTVDYYLSRNRDVNAAKAFLQKGHTGPTDSNQDHARCLCCITPSSCGIASAGRIAEASSSSKQQVPEQSRRTGPPTNQTSPTPDAGLEELPNRSSSHRGHRTGRED